MPLLLGIIGCGEVVRAKLISALGRIPAIRVAAVCDTDPQQLRRVGPLVPSARLYSDPAELLEMQDLHAVAVCTPPASHPALALAALLRGKPVYVEKPLALNAAGCLSLLEAARSAALPAVTGFHMRFHRLVRQAREILCSGALGDIESIRFVWHSPRPDRGIPEWKTRRDSGGGSLVEIAVHHLDLARFLLSQELCEVFAFARDGVRHDESAVLVARSSGGVLISAEFSERSPHEIEFAVSGSRGLLRVDCLRFDGLEFRGPNAGAGSPSVRLSALCSAMRSLPAGLRAFRLGGDYRISYEAIWRHFLDAVQRNAEPEPGLYDGWRAALAVKAALESRRSGRPVALP